MSQKGQKKERFEDHLKKVEDVVRDLESGWSARYTAEEEGHELEEGILVSAAARYYRGDSGRLQGWYIGPRVEFGNVDTTDVDAHAAMFEAEAGYTWITRHRIVFGIGGNVGVGLGWNKDTRVGTGASETKGYPVGNVTFSMGYAF